MILFSVFEFSVIKKCRSPEKLFEFFSLHSKFFSLLPGEMDLTKLQYPSLQSVMDFSKQNVHILCPGTSQYKYKFCCFYVSIKEKGRHTFLIMLIGHHKKVKTNISQHMKLCTLSKGLTEIL